MRPFLVGGETVTVRRVDAEQIRIGDLVFFVDSTCCPILHRIIRRRSQKGEILLQTKGDGLICLAPPCTQTVYSDE